MKTLRKLAQAVLRPWVLVLLGLVALALIIWFAGPLFAFADRRPLESETARWVAMAAVFLAAGARLAWRAWQTRRANAALTAQLAAQPSAPSAEEASASAEAETLRRRFADAMTVLRSAQLGAPEHRTVGGTLAALAPGRYLYQLPWYVFIGPPGSGKTTALLNAGLRFPLADKLGEQKLAGIGGTRNCDWWFTDQAVLIDTAGRYTTQESNRPVDAAAWTNFLALLKKHRPRRPLNGVLVTVSVADLLTQSAPEREVQADAIRDRILELHAELGLRLPVYVLVTKVDLLAGFMEFFGELGKEERAQVWGVTFPLDEQPDARPPLEALGGELAALEKRLEERLVDRLQQERDPGRRALVYGFPQQFAALGDPLRDLMERVFADSRFAQAGLLRGVYFASGTQEGAPFDRVLARMARSLGLEHEVLPPQRPSGKSFFLTRLLEEVVFREQGVAGTDRKVERRNALLQAGALALSLLVAAGLIGAWWSSYQKNRAYVAVVEERVAPVAKMVDNFNAVQSSDVVALLPLLQSVRGLAGASPGETAPRMGWGLYQGDKLGQAADNAYRRLLQDALLPRLQLQLEARLRAAMNDRPEALYDALKTYVMLAQPKQFDPAWFRRQVLADWDASLPRSVTAESRRALEAHLDALIAQAPLASPLPLDHKLIGNARAGLARIPAANRIYDGIRRDPAMEALPAFTVIARGGPSAPLVFTRASGAPLTQGVPGLYTIDVYRGRFEKSAEQAARGLAAEEAWVLGTESGARSLVASDQLREEVRRLYLQDYGKQWEAFVSDLRVRKASGLQDSIQLASALSASDSPLPILLREIVNQVTLVPPADEPPKTLVDKAQSAIASARKAAEGAGLPELGDKRAKLEAELVDQRFDRLRQFVRGVGGKPPAGLDQVAPLMTELYQHLVSVDTAMKRKMPPPPPDVVTKVGAEARRMPDPVGATIAQLAEQATRSQRDVTIRDLNEQFASIAEDCAKAVNGRYPFTRSSATDVLPEDFGRLFGPGGRFDAFVQQDLVRHVDTSTRPWTWRRTGELAGAMTTDGLRQLQRAQAIRDVFFRGGGNKPGLRLDFKPLQMDDSINQFVLDVDGQIVRYAHGPQVPTPVQWPGPRGSGQVRVQLTPPASGAASGLTFEGPWALFRMLDRTQVDATAQPERFNVTFNVDGRRAVFEVTASSVQNPFRLRDLEQFQCPTRL
jgi:type VI secretion system protein ImpL